MRTHWFPSAAALAAAVLLLAPASAPAVDAVDVGFDDSSTTTIQGDDVQEALESADDAVTNLDAVDVGFDDTFTVTIQGDDVQEALESADTAITDLHTGVDADADIVYVRQDCTGMRNCFTSMSDLAGDPKTNAGTPSHPSPFTNGSWLWSVRQPTPASPVLVDVGPGTWTAFSCPDHTAGADFGGVTLRGAGRETTILEGTIAGIDAAHCFDLQVMDLTALGELYGVRWQGEGTGNWHDMDFVAVGSGQSKGSSAGWVDACTASGTASLHYVFGSRSIARGSALQKFGYATNCAETWFFGGEIRVEGPNSDLTGLYVANGSDFRAFGTPIRVLGESRTHSTSALRGVWALGNGASQTQFHLHGGIVSLFGSSAAGGGYTVDVTGLKATGDAFAHAPGSSWVLRAPDGTATRVSTSGGAVAQVPFQWQSGTDEPEAGLVSQTGSDVYVETDCNNSTGVCDGSGTSRPHMMVYDATCTPTPWFDLVTGACRAP